MWTQIGISVAVSLVTMLIMYLDSRLFDKPKTKMVYAKTVIMTNSIVFAVVAFLTWLAPTGNLRQVMQSGGGSGPAIGGASVMVSKIGEEMLAGPAPF
jgi:hypothetical protein